jgi:tetratricopeptide (TPR) repeat protein
MTRYYYSLVEGTYVVRQSRSKHGAEYLTPEGEWIEYSDLWDVITNGRPIANEEEALEKAKKIFEQNPEWWAWQSRMRAGDEAYGRGDYGEAERHWKAQLEFEVNMGSNRSLNNLARLYEAQGRYAEAETIYERSLAMMEKTLGPEHPELSESLNNYTAFLRKMGRDAEAAKIEARLLAIQKPKSTPVRTQLAIWTRIWRWLMRSSNR